MLNTHKTEILPGLGLGLVCVWSLFRLHLYTSERQKIPKQGMNRSMRSLSYSPLSISQHHPIILNGLNSH